MRPRIAIALLAAGLLAPSSAPPPVLDALLSGRRLSAPLAELIEPLSLPAGESFALVDVGRDEHQSHHLVAIRDRETPHRHDRHDLVVVILRGHGGMRLGDDERPVGEGSILYVPRGTVHAFRNASAAPAIAYAIYSPAFDGADRVLVE